jgi:hypothetical protein
MIEAVDLRLRIIEVETGKSVVFQAPSERMQMIVCTKEGHFISECELRLICAKKRIIEINSVVARSGYGKTLYHFAMQYAFLIGGLLVSARDGESCEPALQIWSELYGNNDAYYREKLLPELCKQLKNVRPECEFPHLYFGYSMPISDLYFATSEHDADDEMFEKVKIKSEFYFSDCYRDQSSSFIDIDDPIGKNKPRIINVPHRVLKAAN